MKTQGNSLKGTIDLMQEDSIDDLEHRHHKIIVSEAWIFNICACLVIPKNPDSLLMLGQRWVMPGLGSAYARNVLRVGHGKDGGMSLRQI